MQIFLVQSAVMITDWIATPDFPADYRGPCDRPFTPFRDPSCAKPMVEMLGALAAEDALAVAIDDGTSALSRDALMRAISKVRIAIEDALSASGRVGMEEGRIGVLLPPGIPYSAGIFGALAAGQCCVLLDSSFPEARNAAIAAQTGISLLLTTDAAIASSATDASGLWRGVVTVDVRRALREDDDGRMNDFWGASLPRTFACSTNTLDSPAFILCTSGSSGRPKPIVHSQRTMLHWARTTHNSLHVTPADRVLSLSSPSTLGGLTGLLGFLLGGASLQLLDVRQSGLAGLLNTLRDKPITILRAAPSMMRGLAGLSDGPATFGQLRAVQMYGELLTKADVAALKRVLPPGCLIRTTYGSTEASGLCWFAGEPDDHDPVRVAAGALMPDTMAAILDEHGRSCARGEPGELVIRSRYNALGEWIDGALVAGRIQAHPSGDGTTVYHTGDMARCNDDGIFVALGRADRLVKINGQRLDLSEIECALRQVAIVSQAEVVAYQVSHVVRLMAFVVPASPDAMGTLAATLAAIRAALAASIPSFMIPGRILLLPSMPVLPGGKVDTPALLAIANEGH